MSKFILEVYSDKLISSESNTNGDIDELIAKEVRKEFHREIAIGNSIVLTKENYRNILNDPELRSLFRSTYLPKENEFEHIESILFLLPVIDSGYNFGQYRIASHLISLGITRDKICFYPLYITENRYQYNKDELIELLHKLNPQYVAETAYLGWEKELFNINQLIRQESRAIILMGGPLTSSHLSFCIDKMNADVIVAGHGEYLLEEYFREVGRQRCFAPFLDIEGIYFRKQNDYKISSYVNKNLDFLYWDIPLLKHLCEFAPVINLFTSDVCFGNCVFCYRTNVRECTYMSQNKIIERIEEIINYEPLKELNVKYIRFYDDDFFAAAERGMQLLQNISSVIDGRLKLFELQCSIRSLYKIDFDKFASIVNKLGVQRVTLGVDGYNDEDLRFLQKGYTMEKVFGSIYELSQRNIPCLLYSILTTYITTCSMLNESFLNMLRLVLMGSVYIGPSIAPVISVASNNKKLYPHFKYDKFHFLEVESVSETLENGNKPEEVVMQASLLPRDRIVRVFVQRHRSISAMQSAYVLPLVADFFYLLAKEYNWLIATTKQYKRTREFLRKEHVKLCRKKNIYEGKLYSGKNEAEVVNCINDLNKVKRKLFDNCDEQYIIKDDESINRRIQDICTFIENYVQLFDTYFDSDNAKKISSELSLSVKRLLPIPILIFNETVELCSDTLKCKYQHILDAEFVLDEDEESMFY